MKKTPKEEPARIPNPGSDAAIAAQCKCPVLDNAHGNGAWTSGIDWDKGGQYWITGGCPLHDLSKPSA